MNYYLKRRLAKISTWITLLLHLLIVGLLFFTIRKLSLEAFDGTNNLMRQVFFGLMALPIITLVTYFSPISWLFWWWIDDIASGTEKDGTDLFFLSTSVPTNRKKIFWSKVVSLTSSLTIIYSLFYALPLPLLLWKTGYFTNFTGLQLGLFLAFNFLFIPLFFIAPLVIFLLSLASLESIWYQILKWFGRLSPIIFGLLLVPIGRFFFKREGSKIVDFLLGVWLWLDDNYLLIVSVIIGSLIVLATFTCYLAYKKFLEKDLD